jgi:hypothetical protein
MQFTVQAYEIAARGRQQVCEAIAMAQQDRRGRIEFPDAEEPDAGYRDIDWALAMMILAEEWLATRVLILAKPPRRRQRPFGRFSD